MNNKKRPLKALNILLWITQIILSLSLVSGAAVKLYLSPRELSEMFPWTAEHRNLLIITAVADLLLGIEILLPEILRPQSKLTVISAYGISILMIGASIFHISRGESSDIGINIFFLVLSVFVILGRRNITINE